MCRKLPLANGWFREVNIWLHRIICLEFIGTTDYVDNYKHDKPKQQPDGHFQQAVALFLLRHQFQQRRLDFLDWILVQALVQQARQFRQDDKLVAEVWR